MADTIAFILIEIASGEEYKFVNDVRDLKEVSEAYIVYGAWDIIVRVQTEGMGELNSVVLKVRKMPGVKRSATLIALTGDDI
ncbi:MAG: Lrp/AsnC ligand binding domain-containing protein [Candidatus Hodarchaeota archaeon]